MAFLLLSKSSVEPLSTSWFDDIASLRVTSKFGILITVAIMWISMVSSNKLDADYCINS